MLGALSSLGLRRFRPAQPVRPKQAARPVLTVRPASGCPVLLLSLACGQPEHPCPTGLCCAAGCAPHARKLQVAGTKCAPCRPLLLLRSGRRGAAGGAAAAGLRSPQTSSWAPCCWTRTARTAPSPSRTWWTAARRRRCGRLRAGGSARCLQQHAAVAALAAAWPVQCWRCRVCEAARALPEQAAGGSLWQCSPTVDQQVEAGGRPAAWDLWCPQQGTPGTHGHFAPQPRLGRAELAGVRMDRS